MADILLQGVNLSCERDERLLFSGLNFALPSGAVMQIEGPNGSGKTTLLRILSGLSSNFEGELLFRGVSMRETVYEYRQSLCILNHAPGVKASLSPRENLRWALALSSNTSAAQIDSALDKVGLYGFEDVPAHNLSAGQQRRIALARLYLSKAPLWILDEPFTAIDKQGVKELEALLAEHASMGGSVILTTHHHLQMPGRLQVLRLGDVVKDVHGMDSQAIAAGAGAETGVDVGVETGAGGNGADAF